ncbi:MAG TPA: glutamate--tRNA ligase [Thermoanaerobaculia bacterium]|nr:glutamate--tRNA ligase [Thermoanaerobaculia bacterium]
MPDTSVSPRVRFAPSPTGSLHVGGARTALYNLLFARANRGVFILRIEDTDVERSREDLSQQILSALEWLGIPCDEGPYYQSRRYDLYRAAAEKLLREGKAYRAFETPEELDLERKRAQAEGRAYRYSGAGRGIPPEESDRRARAGEPHVVRLKMPSETIAVEDLIRGRVEFPAEALDDFVLVRSDGHPLYHFCVCVDDADMRITHVIRGDDHLANTPKHVALFRALGAPIPRFAHLGMILGTDKKKLSKRHGAAAVEEWRDAGILPEALFNFLALLGWSPGGDRELMTRAEMEKEFSLDRVGASPSVFDPEKLLWMNAQYMARMPAEKLLEQTAAHMPAISDQQLMTEVAVKVIELHRRRARTIVEMGHALSTYAADPAEFDPDGIKKHVKPETPGLLERLLERLETLPDSDWTSDSLERTLRAIAEESRVPAAKLIHPTRLALTGTTVGAPLFDVVALLGKETTLKRLRKFLETTKPPTPA